eukprot:1194703-Prorocentrum_minimum.AAC.1
MQLDNPLDEAEALKVLAAAPGLTIVNDRAGNNFPTPLGVSDKVRWLCFSLCFHFVFVLLLAPWESPGSREGPVGRVRTSGISREGP